MTYWILKTEPEVYSIQMLLKDKQTSWNAIRNYQAQNNLKKMQKGDLAFIYHTGGVREIVGLAQVIGLAEPEIPVVHPIKPGNWVQVPVQFKKIFDKKTVHLKELKTLKLFEDSGIIRQGRLSVVPLTQEQADWILDACK